MSYVILGRSGHFELTIYTADISVKSAAVVYFSNVKNTFVRGEPFGGFEEGKRVKLAMLDLNTSPNTRLVYFATVLVACTTNFLSVLFMPWWYIKLK